MQHPPPSDTGQDWKPGEHVRGCGVDVVVGEVVVVVEEAEVEEEDDGGVDEEIGTSAVDDVAESEDVVPVVLVVLEVTEEVAVGTTTTVAVEVKTPVNFVSIVVQKSVARHSHPTPLHS